jgi:hypothetical protein
MQLGNLGSMRLGKKDALPGVEAGRQPVKRHLVDIPLQRTGILQRGQGMDINNAIDTIILFLKVNIILYRTQVIAQVLPSGRTGPGKNTLLHPSGSPL